MNDTPRDSLDKLPPQAIDIERALLGAMLLDREAVGIAIEMKIEDSFYRPENAVIYRAMTDLYDNSFPVDQLSVAERLKSRGQFDAVGGEAPLAALVTEAANVATVEYYCRILREKAFLRKLITISTATRAKCFDTTAEPTKILNDLEQGIMDISMMRNTTSYAALKDVVHEAHRAIEEKSEAAGGMTGVDSGFTRLNKLTSGWQPADLIILAGRPSMGKTAFALDLAKTAASNGVPVGVFSLEMSTKQLVMRMLFNEARFDGSALHSRKPTQEDWTRLADACSRLDKYPVFIDDTPGLSTIELAAKAKRLKAEKDIGLIVVDYLQLMQGTSRESRQQEISSISRSLKGLAKELNVPVIALSQLSRALEQRGGDHRPVLADLRESGAIEQDADVVMFIYRAAVYGVPVEYMINDQNVNTQDVAEVIIRKQRNGPIGTVLLHWIKEYTRFGEFDYTSTEEYF